MFENIGKKIMNLAKFLCWIGIIFTISGGIASILISPFFTDVISIWIVVRGLLIAIIGPFVSWVSSFVLYGFGRLIENSDILAGRR